MYRCELCGTQVPERVPCIRVVVATRKKQYPRREDVYLRADEKTGRLKWFPDPGGVGVENAREAKACPDCARLNEAQR